MASGTTCKANGFDYLYGKECKKNCDNFYIIMDEKDAAGVNLLDTKQCFKDLQDALSSGKSSTGYFYDLNEKKVWLNYDSNLYIKYKNGANYEVVQNWQDYYYEESSMKFIVTNCKTVSLYFENDNKKCLSSCTNYFDPTNNECLDSCKKTINLEYADPAATDPKKCINKCPKYFIQKVYGANNIQINECVQTCPASDPTYKFIDVKTNECKTACGSNQYEVTIDNIKYCYPECDVSNGNIYINTDTYDCVKVCPSSLKQFELIKTLDNGKKIYLCKSICKQDEFRYRDECVKKCPNNFNHIGFNGICKESCTEDPNGESFYPVETVTIPTDSGSTTYTIYKCINSCEQAIEANTGITTSYTFYTELNPKECLSVCPTSGYTHYLNSNPNECLANCPDNFPFYGADNKCVSNNVCTGSNLFFDNGQCYGSCQGGKIYYDEKKFCLDECREGEIKQSNGDGTFTCKAVCEKYIYQENSETEPECVPNCKEDKNYVGKNNICKKSCETEDGINYYELDLASEDPPITYKIFKCVDGCKDDYDHFKYREANNGKQCYNSCSSTNGYPYLSEEENLCYSNCLDSIKYPFTLEEKNTDGNIISQKCLQECDTSSDYKYYGKNKKCIKKCDELPEEKLIEYDGIKCVEKCTNPDYLFELRGKCAHECDGDDATGTVPDPLKKRYSAVDYKCKEICIPPENVVKNGKECISASSCKDFLNKINPITDSSGNPTGEFEYECIPSCKTAAPFFYPLYKICISQCDTGDKVVEDLNSCVDKCGEGYYLYKHVTGEAKPYDRCVKNCPSNKPYIDANNECVDTCPPNIKYFVDSESIPHKKCLIDCPNDHPYYTKITDTNSNEAYACKADCTGYYIPNEDTSVIAKFCLNACPDNTNADFSDYKYKLEYENGEKACYKQCPNSFKYHFDISVPTNTDNSCYAACPDPAFYHKRGENICRKQSELTNGYLLYDIKEWASLTKCPDEYTFYSKIDSNGVIVCLKECNFRSHDENNNEYIPYEYVYEYSSPNKICVENCVSSSLVSTFNLKNDPENKKCICQNLYYYDESTRQITCYTSTIANCKDTTSPENKLPLHGTKQCLKTCSDDRILSVNEDECYKENTPCSSIDPNSQLITTSTGQKKCDCAFSFYLDTSDNNKKHCLAEGDYCYSGSYNLYIPELKECVSSCPTTYIKNFKNFCLRNCPSGSDVDGNTCKCQKDATNDKLWYQTSTSNFVCIEGDCPDNFPLYVESTKQCLTSCKGTHYPNLFESKCYYDCASTGIANIIQMEITSDLASFKCYCPLPWYYDNDNKMVCPPNDGTIKKCKDHNKGLDFMIDETRQCLKECPSEYPYYFNNKCYKSCEEANEKYELNIESKESSFECVCPNLWYIDPNDSYKKDKICYRKDINECPRTADITVPSTRYLIESTKECVNARSDCPTNSYKFNFICYDKCPEFTLEGKEPITAPDNTIIQDNICVCNTNGYLYLDYEKYGNKYYRCGLVTCPEIFINEEQEEVRKNLLESENKCVKNCTEDGKSDNEYIKSFRNTCVKKCPNKTETYYDECRFYELTDEDNIDDLNKLKEAANIQAKELYEESEQMSGYLLNKFDASLQIYALSRYNNNKDLIMKSNLTYIDLGTCLERIYEDGNLEDDDKILVTKYDLLTRNNKINNNNDDDGNNDDGDEEPQESIDDKYLINQVEYEFFLESTMEKIEGSICNPYEIEISYPIFFNKNRFNNFAGGINANDYQNKFLIGKELHSKDAEIDTFNKDNKVYKDLCVGVELNGKDLVLEERYDYLYPNNVSICESNCTMKNTDFDLERINCMCTYKEIFDFNRVDEDTNDILNDPNFHKTTQSGANAEIIKCLSKISVKQGIVKNEAFYFSAVVTAVEISMAVVSAVYGVKAVAGFMKGMLGMGQGNSIVNFKKSNPAVTSTNRMLNNPPKKGEENTNEENDEDNKGNIVIKKNIKMNYNPNTINNNEISEIDINNNDNNSNINYGLRIKSGFPKNKKKIDIENEINNKTKVNNKYNTINLYSNKKAEFIPPQYNFKFFKPNDKGIVKKIERSKIPFDVDKDTKILLETKKDVIYDDNYLDGPFYEDQNVIEIIDDINTNKVIKFNESNNNINNNFDSSVIIKKNANRINNKNDISAKEEIPKSKKRRISNKINSEEKDFITIKKINPITSLQMTVEDYKEEEEVKNVDSTTSIYNLVKREHTYLRVTYERYIAKRHPNILATFLAEILDKIYFIKIFIFLKKFDIFSIHLALYMFYHILLLSLLCGFFTIKVIKKIWEDSNYPTMNFYLLYGFLGNVIIWIIYRIFILLLDNQDRFRALVKLHNESMNNNTSRANLDEDKEIKDNDNNKEVNINQQDMINEKYEELIKKIKIQTIVFYIIIILITAFCFIYLVSFFAIYTGTKGKVFKAYYISIIEIILIKFVYGLCLASLRIAGEGNELKSLYNFVYYCDKYVS